MALYKQLLLFQQRQYVSRSYDKEMWLYIKLYQKNLHYLV